MKILARPGPLVRPAHIPFCVFQPALEYGRRELLHGPGRALEGDSFGVAHGVAVAEVEMGVGSGLSPA